MSTDKKHTEAEDFVVAAIKAEGMNAPVAEKEVHTALDEVPGVEQVRVAGDQVTVCYDPVEVTKKELGEKLAAEGHPPAEVTAERDSLLH